MSATVKIGGDISDLKTKLNQAKSEVRNFGGSIKSSLGRVGSLGGGLAGMLGIGSLAAAGAVLKSVLGEFDRVGDLARQLDTSAESVQKLGNMAKLSGTDMESAARALNKLNRVVGEGEGGDAFKELGLNMEEFMKLDSDKQMLMLAEAFQKAEKNGTGLTAAYDLFGRSAAELLPMLRSTREELEGASKIKIVNDEDIAKIQSMNDQLDAMSMTIKSGIASGFVGFTDFFEKLGQGDTESGTKEDAAKAAAADREARKAATAAAAEIKTAEAAAAAEEKRMAPIRAAHDKKVESLEMLKEEIALMQVRATGSEKQIKAAEREAVLRKETKDIMAATGASESDARGVAEDKLKIQESIDKRAQHPNRIKGFTGNAADKISRMGAAPYRQGGTGRMDITMGAPLRGYDGTGGFGTPMGQRMMSPHARAAAMKEGNARRAADKDKQQSQDPMTRLTDISKQMEQHLATLAQGL